MRLRFVLGAVKHEACPLCRGQCQLQGTVGESSLPGSEVACERRFGRLGHERGGKGCLLLAYKCANVCITRGWGGDWGGRNVQDWAAQPASCQPHWAAYGPDISVECINIANKWGTEMSRSSAGPDRGLAQRRVAEVAMLTEGCRQHPASPHPHMAPQAAFGKATK